MNIRTFRKLKEGQQIIHNILGTVYTITRTEESKIYAKPMYYDTETIIEEGEQSFFSVF